MARTPHEEGTYRREGGTGQHKGGCTLPGIGGIQFLSSTGMRFGLKQGGKKIGTGGDKPIVKIARGIWERGHTGGRKRSRRDQSTTARIKADQVAKNRSTLLAGGHVKKTSTCYASILINK